MKVFLVNRQLASVTQRSGWRIKSPFNQFTEESDR